MKVYAIQHDILWEDRPANYQRVRSLLDAAKPEPGSLIVLPEMFATGFSMALAKTLEPKGGETEQFIRELARQHQSCVIGGLVDDDANGKGRNISLAIGPDGSELARYAKMQPFTLGDEQGVHQAGERVLTFAFGGFTIAPLICYDLRFPELARDAVRQGADLFVYIASWPIKRAQHWVTLLQARAIENLAWVVGVNRCGRDPEFTYPGRSVIVDPQGCIVADAADREGVLVTTLDATIAADWRRSFPALRDMRAK
jgi:predicted amidohydrolase